MIARVRDNKVKYTAISGPLPKLVQQGDPAIPGQIVEIGYRRRSIEKIQSSSQYGVCILCCLCSTR